MRIKTTLIGIMLLLSAHLNVKSQDICPYFGVDISGAEWGASEQNLYYPTPEQLAYYQSKGIRLIRFAFRWETIQPALGGELNQAELDRLKKLVKNAANSNIYVILDLHNYCRYKIDDSEYIIGSDKLPVKYIKDLWTRLAEEFKSFDNIYGYGIMNEPHNMLPGTPWFNIAQEIINGIRTRDTGTTIIVGGDSWSSAEGWAKNSDNLKNLVDPNNNIIYEAHQYFDHDSSGKYKASYDDEGAYPNIGVDRVKPFIDWLKENKVRGFIGEYGVPGDDPRWLTVLDNFLKYLKDNKINGTYWAGGPRWGNYKLSIEPDQNGDKPQMSIVEKYLTADPNCSNSNR